MEYQEWKELFKDDLVVAVRKLLERIENKGDNDLEDSKEHNRLKGYFNTFYLHKKTTKEDFEERVKPRIAYGDPYGENIWNDYLKAKEETGITYSDWYDTVLHKKIE